MAVRSPPTLRKGREGWGTQICDWYGTSSLGWATRPCRDDELNLVSDED